MENKKTTGAEDIRWNLTVMYASDDDPAIGRDLSQAEAMMKAFRDSYRGKLATLLAPALRDYMTVGEIAAKPQIYFSLRKSVDQNDAGVKAKLGAIEKDASRWAGECLTFFKLEIMALSEAEIAAQAAGSELLAKHLPWIKKVRAEKPYTLSEEVEAALIKRSPVGPHAWSEFFDELASDLRFDLDGERLNETEIINVFNFDPDRDRRTRALKACNDGLKGFFAKYAAETLNIVVKAGQIEDLERSEPHPMAGRNRDNRLSDRAVTALHAAVRDVAGPLARRYFRLKARMLGIDGPLRWCDRNAKLPFEDHSTVPYGEALKTVLAAYESFSPTLAGMIRTMAKDGWIDAPTGPSKRGGAFNMSYVLPGHVPVSFTMLNYDGTSDDVMTLAHELGHACHGILSGGAQGQLMGAEDVAIAVAETASVFGEMTTFNSRKAILEKSGDHGAVLALVTGKIDDILNTVFRQIGFSEFERRLHGTKEKMSVEDICGHWMASVAGLYGEDGDVFTYDDTDHLWAYIHHFHTPFYVYGYAVGELLTQSLYASRERFGEQFEPMYLDLLRAGGSKDPAGLLAPFGLDPEDPRFWERGILNSLGRMIDEAELRYEDSLAAETSAER